MKLERISAVVHARGSLDRSAHPVPGQSLLLELAEATGDDVLATLTNGTTLRLSGLRRALQDLQPGDVLRVRVLASEPSLELELDGAAPRRSAFNVDGYERASSFDRQTAMRLDQAVLRQIAWQTPDAGALAQSWRNIALARWGLRSSGSLMQELHSSAAAKVLGQAPFREPPAAVQPPTLDRWQFPVYAWGGVQIVLGLKADEEQESSARSRQRSLRLYLRLSPAALGDLLLSGEWTARGFDLNIAVKESASIPLVQQALPKIAEALMRAGLGTVVPTITHSDRTVAQLGTPTRNAIAASAASQLSLSSFRGLAEAAIVLLQVV